MNKGNVLIVDDEEDIRTLVADILDDEGYQTRAVADASSFYNAIHDDLPDLVILDIWLQNSAEDGIDILKNFKSSYPDIPVVMISGHGTIETAVESIKFGAYDFIEKPFKSDRLLVLVQRAIETRALREENKSLKQRIDGPSRLIGDSSAMSQVRQILEKAAPTNSRVLITGEPGTGKDIAAKVLHQQSRRADKPFMVVNCAILQPDRLEAELFGTEVNRGGTGEVVRGVLENASGGTLFLDEISDMPLETQGKIIRVIQDQTFHRVGGRDEINVDVRIVASSNQDLQKAMQNGNFRQDLYYRLSVVPVHIPPLRERQNDIPQLCDYFIEQYAKTSGTPPRHLSEATIAAIQGYDWPGNVRQLKNAIEWIMIMTTTPVEQKIKPDQLPPQIMGGNAQPDSKSISHKDIAGMSLKQAREQFEREYLDMQISRFGGNISKTAAFVGMERSALHRKLKSLDLKTSSPHNETDDADQNIKKTA